MDTTAASCHARLLALAVSPYGTLLADTSRAADSLERESASNKNFRRGGPQEPQQYGGQNNAFFVRTRGVHVGEQRVRLMPKTQLFKGKNPCFGTDRLMLSITDVVLLLLSDTACVLSIGALPAPCYSKIKHPFRVLTG